MNGKPNINDKFPLCDTYALDVWQQNDDNNFKGGRSCPPKASQRSEILFSFFFFYWEFQNNGGCNNNFSARAEFLTEDGRSLFCVEGWKRYGQSTPDDPRCDQM